MILRHMRSVLLLYRFLLLVLNREGYIADLNGQMPKCPFRPLTVGSPVIGSSPIPEPLARN